VIVTMSNYNQINVLIIEDEEYDVVRIKNTIGPFADRIRIADVVSDGLEALALVKEKPTAYDVVLMDLNLSGGLMGEDLVKEIKVASPWLQIVVITKMTINVTDYDFANRLLKAGAYWYGTKYPGDIEYIYQPTDLILSIINAAERSRIERQWLESNQKLYNNVKSILEEKRIVGESPAIQSLRESIVKYAKSDVSILISGSSGTG
jgi:Response regulator containing CheY-like receiver, AAA-type ATPase, and DNA-binding domains